MEKFKAFVDTAMAGRTLLAVLFVMEAIYCLMMPASVVLAMPEWIPIPYFWVFLFGFCWFAVGVSFILNAWTRIMGILIASLIFLAIIFNFSQGLSNSQTFVMSFITIGFYLAFAGGALIVASEGNAFNYGNWSGLRNLGRMLIGFFYFIAGYLHFSYVSKEASIISWMPMAEIWVVFVGICWILVAVSFWSNMMSRPAAVLASVLIIIIACTVSIRELAQSDDFTNIMILAKDVGLIGANLLIIKDGVCCFKAQKPKAG